MSTDFAREQLLDAFDEIGRAAIDATNRLSIAVYGGSALMLASNFRFATADVDIAEVSQPWPEWLSNVVGRIAAHNRWPETWLNDAVTSFLVRSPIRFAISSHSAAFRALPRKSASTYWFRQPSTCWR